MTADPELIDRGLFYAIDPTVAAIPQVGLGIGVDGSRPSYRLPPPRLGEHTEEVLRGLLGLRRSERIAANLRSARSAVR